MTRPLVVIHERRGYWSGQLRARFAQRSIRWRDSRSGQELRSALAESVCPIALIDLSRRPRETLEDLARASARGLDALVIVLAPSGLPEQEEAAREFGATLVCSGFTPPPRVASILDRWLPVAQRRIEAAGPPSGEAASAEDADPLDPFGL